MKYLVAILFSVAVLLQVCSDLVMYAAFKSNQNYIAKNLCENINRPEKHCRGCCYMAKQIKKEKENEGKSTTSDFTKKAASLNWFCVAPHTSYIPEYSGTLVFNTVENFVTDPSLLGVFHPPKG